METLLTAATGQVESSEIFIRQGAGKPAVPCTLYLVGVLGGAETVKLQFYDGTAWRDMYIDDALVELTATNNVRTVYGPLEFRVYKSITAAAVGVGISKVDGLPI